MKEISICCRFIIIANEKFMNAVDRSSTKWDVGLPGTNSGYCCHVN